MNAKIHRLTTVQRFRAIKRPKEYSMPDTLRILWTPYKCIFFYARIQELADIMDSSLTFKDNSCTKLLIQAHEWQYGPTKRHV